MGAAAGTLFTFKGQYRAVLVNYPSRAEKLHLFSEGAAAAGSISPRVT
jgi:cyclase